MKLRNVEKISEAVATSLQDTRVRFATVIAVDGNRADIQLPGSYSVIRNCRIIGDPDTLLNGNVVQIEWWDNGRPVVICGAGGSGAFPFIPAQITDADTLDGQHGWYYLNRAYHTGTQEPNTIQPQGEGSTLDADMLDGLHAYHFLSPSYLVLGNDENLLSERRLVVGDGLTEFDQGAGGDFILSLTQPGTLSVSSQNSSEENHTHAIDHSSNPGASSMLLSTNANGGLRLLRLGVGADAAEDNVIRFASGGGMAVTGGVDITLDSRMTVESGGEQFRLVNGPGYTSFSVASDNAITIGPGPVQIDGTIRSPGAQTGVSGWTIDEEGNADFRVVTADELIVEAFTLNIERALAGSMIIPISMAVLSRNFITPGQGQTAHLYTEDLPGFENYPVFRDGDLVVLRYVDRSGGGLIVQNIEGTVSNYVDLPGGEQRWDFELTSGPSGVQINVDAIALDFGVSGDGYWEVTTLDPLGSPYSQVVTWEDDLDDKTVWVRSGNIKGVTGFGQDEWGMYVKGPGSSMLRLSSEYFEVRDLAIGVYDNETQVIRLDPDSLSFAMGSPLPDGYLSDTGVWMGEDNGDFKLHIGDPNGNHLKWDGTDLEITGKITAASGYIGGWTIAPGELYSSGFHIKASGTAADNQIYVHTGGGSPQWGSANTPIYMDGSGKFSLGENLKWDGDVLTITGITVTDNAKGFVLDSALLYVTFDGPLPVATNRHFMIDGHKGQVPTIAGDVYAGYGKFGKCIVFGAAVLNVVQNPSFETSGNWVGGNITSYEHPAVFGSKVGRMSYSTGSATGSYQDIAASFSSGEIWVGSVYVKGSRYTVGKQAYLIVGSWEGGNLVYTAGQQITLSNEWQLITAKHTTTASGTTMRMHIMILDTTPGNEVFADAAMLVRNQNGHLFNYWDNTFDGSSLRSNGYLTYPSKGNLNPLRGTISFWYRYPDVDLPADNGRIFEYGSYTSPITQQFINLQRHFSQINRLLFNYYTYPGGQGTSVSFPVPPDTDWHMITLTWEDGEPLRAYVDGELAGTGGSSLVANTYLEHDSFRIGGNGTSNSNMSMSHFLILDRALSGDEIARMYAADAPPVIQVAPHSLMVAGDAGKVTVNASGVFSDSADGNAVLTVVNQATTLSRGGFNNLSDGDIVIGHNRPGSSAILWDKSTGTFGFYGGGSGTAKTTINADGSITATNANISGTITATSGSFTGTINATGGSFTGTINATSGSFSGSITSTSGTIGGWSLSSDRLSAQNIRLISGLANTARLEVGTGSTSITGGVNAPANSGDPVFWAGSTHANWMNAPFRVLANGQLVATNATITGNITATSGSFTGTVNATSGNFSGSLSVTGLLNLVGSGEVRAGPATINNLGITIDSDVASSGLLWSRNGLVRGVAYATTNHMLFHALRHDEHWAKVEIGTRSVSGNYDYTGIEMIGDRSNGRILLWVRDDAVIEITPNAVYCGIPFYGPYFGPP